MSNKARAVLATLIATTAVLAAAVQAPVASAASATTTTVNCLPANVPVGSPTTCVVDVVANGLFPFAPTGTVGMSSTSAGTFSGPCTLHFVSGGFTSAHSQCAVTYTPLAVGPATIIASYPGDANSSPSGDTTIVTATDSTTTTVTCSVGTIGVTGTCTATVTANNATSPPQPTGLVTFNTSDAQGVFTPASCSLIPSGPASSSCTVGYKPGSPSATVTATYTGNAFYGGSQGHTTVTAALRTTTTTVSCVPSSFVAGSTTTCTATVRDVDAGTRTAPQGGVSFSSNDPSATFAPTTCVLVASGPDTSKCSTTYHSTAAGTWTVKASYSLTDFTHKASAGTTSVTVTAGAPATVTVSPGTATNPVDTQHCVTARVEDAFSNPTAGVPVVFSVTGVNQPASAVFTTDATGTAGPYCYVGVLFGTDTIKAAVDSNTNGQPDPTDVPFGEGTKAWTVPASSPLCQVDFATYGGRITADNGDRATFGGNVHVSDTGDASGQEEYQDHGPAQPMDVKSVTVLGAVCSRSDATHAKAEIFGEATIDGSGSYGFRIDVADNGEPGSSDTYEIQLSNGYDSGQHTLDGGNVQIH